MPQPLYCFFGHHKCASTWIHSILDQVVADTGHRLAYLYDAKLFDEDLPAYLEKNRFEFVSYVNADLRYTKDLENVRGFHVVRDPRDLLVSAYFSHKGTHPTHAWEELIPHREKLNQVDKQEGLLLEMDFNNDFLEQIATWDYDQPNILELKQEEFAPDPYRGFLQVFQHLGLLDDSHYNKQRWIPYLLRSSTNIANRLSSGAWPLRMKMGAIPGERLLGIVYDNRFEKYAGGRQSGKEDTGSHYRKGVAGDWVNHFTERHVAAFKERFGDLVERLGYEQDSSWTVASAGAHDS